MNINQAFILAAGLGTRMGAASKRRPKPLLELGGAALIEHAIGTLSAYGCAALIVNIHAHADQMRRYLTHRHPSIRISDESQRLMGTGGALTHAYRGGLLADAPFFTHNCDAIFPISLPARAQILAQMAQSFLPDHMDGLLLLKESADGDFARTADNRIDFGAGYAYTGVQILSPHLIARATSGIFEIEALWQDAIGRRRLYGHVMTQDWAHVGTAEALRAAEKKFFSPPPADMRK